MLKSQSLLEFCHKTGIFTSCTESNTATFGPYGQLLLKQIKKQWLRANFNKFKHNFLIDSTNNLLHKNNGFNLNFFINSLPSAYDFKQLPIGLLNVHTSSCYKNKPSCEWEHPPNKFFLDVPLDRHESNKLMHLNAFHFYNNDCFVNDTEIDIMKSDPLSFWQRERKNWWVKLFSFPEYVKLDHLSTSDQPDHTIDKINISYNPDNQSPNYLENVQHITNLNTNDQAELKRVFQLSEGPSNFLIKETSQMIITQTTAENVLEKILVDSVQYRRKKSEVLKTGSARFEKQKMVFRLNYKLAPYKACILYNEANDNYKEASTIQDVFRYNQIDVLMMPVKSESHLDERHDHLDTMGIPYSIYLPPSLAKDGICFVRNRETTLQEHLHISLLVKQFLAISNALSF